MQLQVFNYTGREVRTVSKDGELWFVARDVCDILEIGNAPMAVSRLTENMRGISTVDTLGGKQQLVVISESGVYKLVFTSRKPEAERFTDWLANEVIPSIRKHGAYVTSTKLEEMLADPDTMIKTLTALKEERAARLKAESQVKDMEPKALFADSVTASSTSILVADLAKILKQNGINIGEIRLWEWLRNHGYAIRERGRSYNMPTQYSMERGIMEVKEGTYINSHGESTITKTTLVTGKGQIYFLNKFLNKQQVV